MGQKVNPIAFRLAVYKDWRSKWYAEGEEFSENLHSDLRIRNYIRGKLQYAALSKILIERAWNSVRVTLHTARPGLVIGRKGSEIERMQADLSKMCDNRSVKIDIIEIKQPELDAQLVAENVAMQLERRIAFRRAMKRALQTTMDFGAEGIRIRCAGRLGGADIARAEWYREGKVPLQTLRVPIDYGFVEARTGYGIIGVKCWINKKEETVEKSEGGNTRPRSGGRPGGAGKPADDAPRSGGPVEKGGEGEASSSAKKAGPVPKKAAVVVDKKEEAPASAPEEAKDKDAPKTEVVPTSDAPATEAPAAAAPSGGKVDEKLGLVFESKPDEVDDLKQITGVGPQLEGKLHGFGVYQFGQIAAWGDKEVAAFDDLLAFKGRIERDEWIKQAKEFAKG